MQPGQPSSKGVGHMGACQCRLVRAVLSRRSGVVLISCQPAPRSDLFGTPLLCARAPAMCLLRRTGFWGATRAGVTVPECGCAGLAVSL